jgi:hypothetical protein
MESAGELEGEKWRATILSDGSPEKRSVRWGETR